jgi:DNA-binding SARP family transcriptional activator
MFRQERRRRVGRASAHRHLIGHGPASMAALPAQQPRRAATLRIELLGPPTWRGDDGAHARIKAKDAALIAYLAIQGAQERDALARLLWPAVDLALATSNLRQRISRLRRETAHGLFAAGAAVSLLDTVSVDLHDRLAGLSPAELLARGDLLAGHDYTGIERLNPWVARERERWRHSLADALTGHAAQMEQRGELAAALALGERILALVPVQEIAWRRQMRLHYLRGDRAAAIDAFDRFEKLVAGQIGMRPSDETLELLATVQRAAPQPTPRATLPASLVRPPVRVGRDAQWTAMARAWAAGRPFLLRADAGLGKTRLLTDFLQGTAGGVAAEGRPGDEPSPYAVLARLLRAVLRAHPVDVPAGFTRHELSRILAEWGPPPETPTGQQAALWQAVENLLLGAHGAGLRALVIDDLQFADVASVETLRWLSASRPLAGLRFGLATRPEQRPPLSQLVDDWLTDSQRPEAIDLPLFTRADTERLIGSLGVRELDPKALADVLFLHVGGHPFLSLETMKDLVLRGAASGGARLPRPATAEPLLQRRLRAVPAEQRDLLHLAAVMGGELSVQRAAAVLRREVPETLAGFADLQACQVFDGPRFAHELLRECALQQVPAAQRLALHATVAETLAADASVPPARLAFHWEAAERWPEAAASLHAAGLAARLAGRLEEQRALAERAAQCWRQAGQPGGEFEALNASMESVLVRQGPAAVLDELPRLQALADTPARELAVLLLRAEALVHLMRSDEGLRASTEAVQRAEQHPQLLAEALTVHGMALAQGRRVDEAIETLGRSAAVAERQGSTQQALRVTHAQVYVLYEAGRIGDAITAAHESLRLTRAAGDHGEAAQVEGNLSTLLMLAGDPAAAHEAAQRVRRQHQAMGSSSNSILGGMNLLTLGNAAAYLGRFDEALEALNAAVHMLGGGTPVAARTKARLSLANLWLTLGDDRAARSTLPPLTDDVPPAMQVQWHWAQARIERMAGGAAEAHLRRIGEIQAAHRALPLVQSAWIEWSRQGDAASVIERLRPVRRDCERLGLPGTARTLLLREIDRLADVEGAGAAALAARLAAEAEAGIGLGLHATTYLPEAWLILAAAFDRAGEATRAGRCRDAGRRWIDSSARDHLAPALTEAFLRRNPVNRALMHGVAPRP